MHGEQHTSIGNLTAGPGNAYINRIGTAVPTNDVHEPFVDFGAGLLADERTSSLFRRVAARSGIRHRYSVLSLDSSRPDYTPELDGRALYRRGAFPATAHRMLLYERTAPALARQALDRLHLTPAERTSISHVIVTSCTGLYAPGLDFEIIDHLGLRTSVERTMIGFMGCYAAMNALKLARHIVRSEPASGVLILNLELCTLHFQETQQLEQVLSFLVFSDGCAATLISAQPTGLAIDSFAAVVIPDTRDLITWSIRDLGFDMLLSGRVPTEIARTLRNSVREITGHCPTCHPSESSSRFQASPRARQDSPELNRSWSRSSHAASSTALLAEASQGPPHRVSLHGIDRWAVHPGGRSVLDAVEDGLGLPPRHLAESRRVLDRFGNMSSATVMFVLDEILRSARPGETGCAMSFGPGLTAETMRFHVA